MSKTTGFIDFDIVGNDRGVQFMLNQIDSALSPVGLKIFLEGAVGPWVKERATDRFRSEGDDASGKWAPLQQSTIEIRGEQFGPGPINVRTHELENYITQSQVGVVSGPGLATLKYPQDVPKSPGIRQKMETAQKGRANPKTVARPVLALNERDLGQVLVMLGFFVQSGGTINHA